MSAAGITAISHEPEQVADYEDENEDENEDEDDPNA